MMWTWASKRNIFLLFLLFVIIILNWTLYNDPSVPNLEFMPEMTRSVPYDSYSPNPNFSDHRTLQQPAPHTIARGHMPLRFAKPKTDEDVPGKDLLNPFRFLQNQTHIAMIAAFGSLDAHSPLTFVVASTNNSKAFANSNDLRKRGELVFRNVCAVCHGQNGSGKCPVTQRSTLPAKSLLTEDVAKLTDGQLFYILTFGRRSMPPVTSQLSREERWLAIEYLRFLQQQAPPSKKGES